MKFTLIQMRQIRAETELQFKPIPGDGAELSKTIRATVSFGVSAAVAEKMKCGKVYEMTLSEIVETVPPAE